MASIPASSAQRRLGTIAAHLHDPNTRDSHYGQPLNVAQYLVDLHDSNAVFDFCGGIMFQLQLSQKLREHLVKVAESGAQNGKQPTVYDAAKMRMFQVPGYKESNAADNKMIFYGREVREVPHAAGGMGCVLQLVLAGPAPPLSGEEDPDGWTPQEIKTYDGWGHDSQRTWRNGEMLEAEGFKTFRKQFGAEAFTLNHRFYLHFDEMNRMWLSAEDGCEGYPIQFKE